MWWKMNLGKKVVNAFVILLDHSSIKTLIVMLLYDTILLSLGKRSPTIEDKWLRVKKEIDENWNYENILILQFIFTRTFSALAFF